MKRIALLLGIILLCLSACSGNGTAANEEYFYKINSLVRDIDFHTANVKDEKIILYDEEKEIVDEIPFDEYDAGINLTYIRKDDPVVYFVTGGDADDEQGIIFINDDTNGILDGVKSLKRIGGNSYEYSTVD